MQRGRRRRAGFRVLVLALLLGAPLVIGTGVRGAVPAVVEVTADGETVPVRHGGDAADDPAIWVHPTDPSRSVVIGNDKQGALEVYDLAGTRIQRISGGFFGNVDVRPGFPVAGRTFDLVAVAHTSLRFYEIDPDTRLLTTVTDGGTDGDIGGFHGAEGLCLYHSPVSGRFSVFVNSREGEVAQFEIGDADADGLVDAVPVRAWSMGSEVEGCVADDELGSLYLSEESVGIWKYGAEPTDPSGPNSRILVDSVSDTGHLVSNVEGLTLVDLSGGAGYLLASAQAGTIGGRNAYVSVYRREGANPFVNAFRVVAGPTADGCSRTDGIAALAADLGPAFPSGLFVCQDHINTAPGTAGNQNFKYVRLERLLDLTETPPPIPHTDPPPAEPPAPDPPAPDPPVTPGPAEPAPAGYWILGSDGAVFPFGDVANLGAPARLLGQQIAVDVESTRSAGGYWVLDDAGRVHPYGDARPLGGLPADRMAAGERVTGLSRTPSGEGYWIFTSRGRVFGFGDAPALGDLSEVSLNSPVVHAVATPSGRGYTMVAADGGVFAFGGASFSGSLGGRPLNAPIRSLVADPDGSGYWLVASDGGVFAFDAPYRGSLGGVLLNRPVVGMATFGDGYLLVAEDGGIFNFSSGAFQGSLGGDPHTHPIVAVAAGR